MEHQDRPRANLPLLGAIVARMIRRAVADGRWTVDAAGRARPVDMASACVVEFPPAGRMVAVEEEDHAAS